MGEAADGLFLPASIGPSPLAEIVRSVLMAGLRAGAIMRGMKQLALALPLVLFLFSPAAAAAFDDGRRMESIGLLIGDDGGRRVLAVQNQVARELERSLREHGIEVRRVDETIESLREVDSRADAYIEISDLSSDSHESAEFRSGGRVGSVGIGGEVSIVSSVVRANVRIIDGESLSVIDSFELDASAGGPMLTAVGLGGRHGFGFLPIPRFSRGKEKAAARELGRECAARVREYF